MLVLCNKKLAIGIHRTFGVADTIYQISYVPYACFLSRAVSVYMVKSLHFSFLCLDPSPKSWSIKNTERSLFLLYNVLLGVYSFLLKIQILDEDDGNNATNTRSFPRDVHM